MTSQRDSDWLYSRFSAAIPQPPPASVVEWAELSFRIVGSAKTEQFSRATAPWLNEVINCANTPGRYTFIKPIQSGGTTAGEIIIGFWISTWNSGDIAYYWPNDQKADDRWYKYTEKRLLACAPLMARTSANRHAWKTGLILFPHLNFFQLGVRSDRNVSSDTIRGIVSEELHDVQGGWEPGKLDQVYGRQTAVWNRISFNISNAGRKGDQLHQAFESGSQEHWEVRCPGCGLYHVMRGRWDSARPDLGGLRYDASDCRKPDGTYNYTKLAPTLRYQMPCGYLVRDHPRERRELSTSGRYGAARNPGASNERSFTLEAVAVHDVSWLDLVKQKHKALRALKLGDPGPWEIYQREQECIFWDAAQRPDARPIVLQSDRRKDRAGLPGRAMRYAAGDYQRGGEGELTHWWLVIRDFDADGNSLLVWEGRCEDEAELVGQLTRHDVRPMDVTLDSGFAAKETVYPLCLKRGYCCIKVEGERGGISKTYLHENGEQRIFSEPRLLYQVIGGMGPTRDEPALEPRFWLISKWGAMERLAALRASGLRWDVPGDVSEDYKVHMACWSYTTRRAPMTGEVLPTWKAASDQDHLYQDECYIAVNAEMDGLIGIGAIPESESK